MEQQSQEPETPQEPKTTQEPVAAQAQSHEDSSGGFLTTVVCVLVILGFAGWIVWLSLGGEKLLNKEPKRLTVEQVHKTMAEAEKADPELKAMLVSKVKVKNPKAPVVKVDVNIATAEQLAKVPGLNEWDVNAIIKKRPFASLDELRTKNALGEARYDGVKEFLTLTPGAPL